MRIPTTSTVKKMLGVTFDMSDPLEKDLLTFVEDRTDNFSNLVKHLLFAWRNRYLDVSLPKRQPSREAYEIRNSGIPFG